MFNIKTEDLKIIKRKKDGGKIDKCFELRLKDIGIENDDRLINELHLDVKQLICHLIGIQHSDKGNKALKYISIRMRSKKEMRDYLKKYEYSPSEISFALDSLQKDGYLDDKAYAKAYVNDQINLGSHGPRRIYYDLKKLGIDEKYINDALNQIL